MPRTVDIEVLAPVAGLHYDLPGVEIDKKAATYMQNMRLKQGMVMPSPGYNNFGSLNTVLGTPQLITQYIENDGDTHLLCFTTKYIYEYNTSLNNWGNVVSRQKILSECDSVWTASANVTAATEGTIKVNGTNSAKLTIAAAFTTGIAGYINFAAVNTTTCSYIHFWIRSTVNTTNGQLRLAIDDTNNCASPLTYYDVPALTADTWTQVEVAIGSGSAAAIVSVGLDVVTDMGAGNPSVYIDRVIAVDRHTGTADNRWSVDSFLDICFATNGVDPIQRKDHSGQFDDWAEAVTATYKCKQLRSYKDHLVMASMIEAGVEYPQRVRWTDSGADAFTGTAGSTETDGVDECLSLVTLGNKLACYKSDSIVMITHIGGNEVYRFDRNVTSTGVLAPDLALSIGELHIFVSSDNVYFYNGGTDPVPIGDPIRHELYRVLSDTYIYRAFSYYSPENQEAYFFIPCDGASAANYIWTYHVQENTWSLRKKENLSAVGAYNTVSALTFGDAVGTFGDQTLTFGDRTFSSTAPIILVGTTDGWVGQIDETLLDDLTVAIDKMFDTVDFTASSLPIPGDEPVHFTDNTKRWVRLAFEMRGTATTIYYSRDEGVSWTQVKTQTLTGTWKRYYASIDVPSERIRFRFRNNSVGGAFHLRWYSISVIGRSEV